MVSDRMAVISRKRRGELRKKPTHFGNPVSHSGVHEREQHQKTHATEHAEYGHDGHKEHDHGAHEHKHPWYAKLGVEHLQTSQIENLQRAGQFSEPYWKTQRQKMEKPDGFSGYVNIQEVKSPHIDTLALRTLQGYLERRDYEGAKLNREGINQLLRIGDQYNRLSALAEEINALKAAQEQGYVYDPMLQKGFMTAHRETIRKGFEKEIFGQKTKWRKLGSPVSKFVVEPPGFIKRLLTRIPLGEAFERYYTMTASGFVNAATWPFRRKNTVGKLIAKRMHELELVYEKEKNELETMVGHTNVKNLLAAFQMDYYKVVGDPKKKSS